VDLQLVAASALTGSGLSRNQAQPAVGWLQVAFPTFADTSDTLLRGREGV
jgi:hypothetical protein